MKYYQDIGWKQQSPWTDIGLRPDEEKGWGILILGQENRESNTHIYEEAASGNLINKPSTGS